MYTEAFLRYIDKKCGIASRTHTEAQLHLQFTYDHDGPPDAHDAHDAHDAITAKLYQ